MTAGPSFAGRALKVLELYAGKLARTVLRGRKLPGPPSKEERVFAEKSKLNHSIYCGENCVCGEKNVFLP